jgi:serine/threonine protein kinase
MLSILIIIIKMEINLLQRLRHKNIVKYVDHYQSKHCIYKVILLELLLSIKRYMEIGSLATLVKKHGVFPGTHCAL